MSLLFGRLLTRRLAHDTKTLSFGSVTALFRQVCSTKVLISQVGPDKQSLTTALSPPSYFLCLVRSNGLCEHGPLIRCLSIACPVQDRQLAPSIYVAGRDLFHSDIVQGTYAVVDKRYSNSGATELPSQANSFYSWKFASRTHSRIR